MINFNCGIGQRTWDSDGRGYNDTLLLTSKTNINGDATFKMKSSLILNEANVFYYIGTYIGEGITPDSNSNDWKYFGDDCELFHNGNLNTNPVIEVYPACEIIASIKENVWKDLAIDSVFFQNKPYYEKLIRNYYDQSHIYVECSSTNKITYYYYSNGTRSKDFIKELYVPFSSQNGKILNIDFSF